MVIWGKKKVTVKKKSAVKGKYIIVNETKKIASLKGNNHSKSIKEILNCKNKYAFSLSSYNSSPRAEKRTFVESFHFFTRRLHALVVQKTKTSDYFCFTHNKKKTKKKKDFFSGDTGDRDLIKRKRERVIGLTLLLLQYEIRKVRLLYKEWTTHIE